MSTFGPIVDEFMMTCQGYIRGDTRLRVQSTHNLYVLVMTCIEVSRQCGNINMCIYVRMYCEIMLILKLLKL